MATLDELMNEVSPARRAKIEERAEEMVREITLAQMREELQISQTELAATLGVKQPAVARMERVDNDPRLSTLKRYVAALGGELSIDVKLPSGKRVAYPL
ncbi:transcriptional regulator with XRE-family HTH domain [Erwinia persicina]|jgi:transcriptional regulator with XRE-family HTH domain|uniref:Helix-turn-helix domain-containing protein n=2 Tax=Erwinia TaxID=551 RepID=A0ABV4E6V9_9GAMM|nr:MULTISPECIES: helix-turn-helix domain-containing protein [Erwinia]MCP1438846.1 transcriptional regulator with XRE-family HTH domain [Erwinia persicina]MDN4626856.1 XRE family transcriptional regulator [Erwinia sp. PsM31]MDN8542801.1 XRE family transcriptional regulator [Erwinia sp. BC051422]